MTFNYIMSNPKNTTVGWEQPKMLTQKALNWSYISVCQLVGLYLWSKCKLLIFYPVSTIFLGLKETPTEATQLIILL